MNSKSVVTVLEGQFPAPGLGRIADRADIRVVKADGLREALPGSQVLFLWDFFSPAVTPLLGGAHDLKWVHIAATGVDKLLVPEFIDSPAVLTNAGGIFDRPMAEYVLACVFAHYKELATTWSHQTSRTWLTRETRNVAGSTALVIGAGGIGRETARLLQKVGMRTILVGRTGRDDAEFGRVHGAAELKALAGGADVIVGALPLTPETNNLISREVIDSMPAESFFINVGRGGTVDQPALTQAILDRRIAGAALDTFTEEPLPDNDPLWDDPAVLVSPHTSSRTTGWLDRLADQFCGKFDDWHAGRPLTGVIDKLKGYPA